MGVLDLVLQLLEPYQVPSEIPGTLPLTLVEHRNGIDPVKDFSMVRHDGGSELLGKNRDFLWGSSADDGKIHYVGMGWNKVTKNLRNLEALAFVNPWNANIIAMAKLNWRVNVDDKVWSSVLLSEYIEIDLSLTIDHPLLVFSSNSAWCLIEDFTHT